MDIDEEVSLVNHFIQSNNHIMLCLQLKDTFNDAMFMFEIIPRHQNMTIECDIMQWRKTISNKEFRQYRLRYKLLEA